MDWVSEIRPFLGWVDWLNALLQIFIGVAIVYPSEENNNCWVSENKLRQWTYFLALPIHCLSLGLDSVLDEWKSSLVFSDVVLVIGLTDFFSAIVFSEMLRVLRLWSNVSWSNKKHLLILVLIWLGLFGLMTLGTYSLHIKQ